MIFGFFALGVAALFFVGCLIMLSYGRRLGLRYLRRNEVDGMVGLPTVEAAVFALIGLLIAFAISGALQRFDERRQLVIQEANAISTTYDRLGLFDRDVARDLQTKLKEYVSARIELYRMPHDFSFWEGAEVWPREQQDKILELKNCIWGALVTACPHAQLSASVRTIGDRAFQCTRGRATTHRRRRKTSASNFIHGAIWAWPWYFAACRLWDGPGQGA